MGIIRLPSLIANAKQFSRLQSVCSRRLSDVPKGYMAVYVGEIQKTRFVVPISFLEQPQFQDLLHKSEDEFGFDHPMGGLTIHCEEEVFIDLTSRLRVSWFHMPNYWRVLQIFGKCGDAFCHHFRETSIPFQYL